MTSHLTHIIRKTPHFHDTIRSDIDHILPNCTSKFTWKGSFQSKPVDALVTDIDVEIYVSPSYFWTSIYGLIEKTTTGPFTFLRMRYGHRFNPTVPWTRDDSAFSVREDELAEFNRSSAHVSKDVSKESTGADLVRAEQDVLDACKVDWTSKDIINRKHVALDPSSPASAVLKFVYAYSPDSSHTSHQFCIVDVAILFGKQPKLCATHFHQFVLQDSYKILKTVRWSVVDKQAYTDDMKPVEEMLAQRAYVSMVRKILRYDALPHDCVYGMCQNILSPIGVELKELKESFDEQLLKVESDLSRGIEKYLSPLVDKFVCEKALVCNATTAQTIENVKIGRVLAKTIVKLINSS